MSATRTVFLDVDGTLVDHTQRLAPSVVEAVQGARRNGHLVFVATGRSRSEIPESVLDIGFDGVISAAGGYLEYQGVLIAEHTLPEADVEEIAEFLGRHNVEYNLQAFDAVFPSLGLTALIERAQAHNADVSDARAAAGASLPGPGSGERIAKVTFYGEHASTYATVRDGLGDRFHVITGTIPWLGEAGGEISLPGINKGAAITEMMAVLSRPVSGVVAIGDSVNDLEMFDVAGVSIAMGNASPAIQAHAHEVTSSVDNDGVWTAFRRHGLI